MRKSRWRGLAVERSHDHAHCLSVTGNAGQLVRTKVRKGWYSFLVRLRERRPSLYAKQTRTFRALFGSRALRVHDSAARRHQVELARLDGQRGAETVAMHDLAVEQIGDRGEPDMGMRAYVDSGPDEKLGRPHLIKEDERPDHLLARCGQRTAHGKAAQVASTGNDDLLDGLARARVAGYGIVVGLPAHIVSTYGARFARPASCLYDSSDLDLHAGQTRLHKTPSKQTSG
jgi:hypothetical protein